MDELPFLTCLYRWHKIDGFLARLRKLTPLPLHLLVVLARHAAERPVLYPSSLDTCLNLTSVAVLRLPAAKVPGAVILAAVTVTVNALEIGRACVGKECRSSGWAYV